MKHTPDWTISPLILIFMFWFPHVPLPRAVLPLYCFPKLVWFQYISRRTWFKSSCSMQISKGLNSSLTWLSARLGRTWYLRIYHTRIHYTRRQVRDCSIWNLACIQARYVWSRASTIYLIEEAHYTWKHNNSFLPLSKLNSKSFHTRSNQLNMQSHSKLNVGQVYEELADTRGRFLYDRWVHANTCLEWWMMRTRFHSSFKGLDNIGGKIVIDSPSGEVEA